MLNAYPFTISAKPTAVFGIIAEDFVERHLLKSALGIYDVKCYHFVRSKFLPEYVSLHDMYLFTGERRR